MEIAVKELPKCIRSFSFSPRIILSDIGNIDFLIQAKEYLFGRRCCEAAEKLKIDLFDLVFIEGRPFCKCFENVLKKETDPDTENILKTAFVLKKMYAGENVAVSRMYIKGDFAYLKNPEYYYISITGNGGEILSGKKKIKENKDIKLDKYAEFILKSLDMAALGYTMKRCMAYKELTDKYNFRRFSTNLRLNNRPAELDHIKAAMSLRKDRLFADFSKDKTRINFSVLYAIAYGGYTIEDIYSRNTVFEANSNEKEKRLSDLSSDLLTILYNGNGIEISGMMINMIVNFTRIKLPPVDPDDLDCIIENFSAYYAVANLAAICENIFKFDSEQHGGMKDYLRRHTFYNYWTVMDRLMLMKQYSAVVAYCHKISEFDIEMYREVPEYQGSVQYLYDSAEKFAEELRKNG